jgi:subtilisin family serine protease
MITYRVSHKARVLALAGILLTLAAACSAAMAQVNPNSPGRGPRGGDYGGNGPRGPRVGGVGIILSLPGVVEGLNKATRGDRDDDHDDDVERAPRPRVRPAARTNDQHDDDDGDDDGPAVQQTPQQRRVATPSLPRLNPPTPLKRAAMLEPRPLYKPGEVVVLIRADNPDTVANGLAQTLNLQLLQTLNFALLETGRVYRFGIPDDRTVETVLASMTNTPGVSFAAPNRYYWLQGEAGGAAAKAQYALPKMRVAAAQSIARGKGMSVAVIDSGVDTKHPSLKHAKLTVIDTVEEGIAGPDMHGTAIAGIIAASDDMVGIAPAARIIAARAFAPLRLGEQPRTTATALATAVDEAFTRGARLFNMSFAAPEREPLLIEIIDGAANKGAVFVAAAGNDGPNAPPAYPAAHDKVIAITATDEKDALYEQANRGGYIFAAAPGVDIFAPVTGKGFDFLSGTSFAAAHVTGIVALLMERNPDLTAEAIRSALTDAAKDLGERGADTEFGAGLTDAYGALLLVNRKTAKSGDR